MPEAPNAVRELAEDATSRKKFLRQAGGTGVAASLAAFIAACGGDDSSSSSMKSTPAATATAMGKSGTEQFGKGDLGIANYALTLEYLEADFYSQVANSGMLKGKVLDLAALVRRRGAGARRRADRADQEGGRQARLEAEGDVPARLREGDPRSSPRPSRTSAPAPTSARPATSRTRRSWPPRSRSTRSRRATRRSSTSPPAPSRPAGPFAKPVTADEVLKAVKPFLAS